MEDENILAETRIAVKGSAGHIEDEQGYRCEVDVKNGSVSVKSQALGKLYIRSIGPRGVTISFLDPTIRRPSWHRKFVTSEIRGAIISFLKNSATDRRQGFEWNLKFPTRLVIWNLKFRPTQSANFHAKCSGQHGFCVKPKIPIPTNRQFHVKLILKTGRYDFRNSPTWHVIWNLKFRPTQSANFHTKYSAAIRHRDFVWNLKIPDPDQPAVSYEIQNPVGKSLVGEQWKASKVAGVVEQ
jgi:hypothetical protein